MHLEPCPMNEREPLEAKPIEISVVSPVYEAATIVTHLIREITASLSLITDRYEIILVDDGSKDESWKVICAECEKDRRVRGVKLSRNFGQHHAITAGLAAANGEWIVVMDCDLQDRPDQIPLLYQTALEGFDTVCAQRINRNDSAIKKLYSKVFYGLFSYLTATKQDASIGNFGIYNRKVITAILSMNEATRYFPVMVQWVGFKKTKAPVLHAARFHGKTTYNTRKLIRLAAYNIISFSDKPLRLVVLSGILISGISLLIGAGYALGHLLGMVTLAGYTSLIVAIWLTTGMVIFVLGVVGLYIGQTFEHAKMRPHYLIDKSIN
jgi:dolichol-phosphate mannosyltransferase